MIQNTDRKKELSKHVLGMRFMQTPGPAETVAAAIAAAAAAAEAAEAEAQAEAAVAWAVGQGDDCVVQQDDSLRFEQYTTRFGRRSFQGFNSDVERLYARLCGSERRPRGEESESASSADTGMEWSALYRKQMNAGQPGSLARAAHAQIARDQTRKAQDQAAARLVAERESTADSGSLERMVSMQKREVDPDLARSMAASKKHRKSKN